MNARAVILAESNRNGTPTGVPTFPTHYRSLGSHVIKGYFEDFGTECTVVDFCFHFDKEKLIDGVVNYLSKAEKQYICFSGALNFGLSEYYVQLGLDIKERLPNAKILFGGGRKVQKFEGKWLERCDAVFLGRAYEMLRDYLNDNDMSKYIKNTDYPYIYTNHDYNYDLEKPVSYSLFKHDDFLNSTDVVGFEVALGCKFNCSFCNYPLRGSKTLYMNCEEQLYYTMQNAYDEYGITHFYAADDTINEADDKLQLLVDVVKRLSFKPKIAAMARLDVLSKRPQQIDMMRECGISALLFGIESLGQAAGKKIKKKSTMDDLHYVSDRIRKEIPDMWLNSGFIYGLVGDSFEEMDKNLRYIEDNKLLDSIAHIVLHIAPKEEMVGRIANGKEIEWVVWDEGAFADMDLYPERFGYNIDPNTGHWYNDYTSFEDAEKHMRKAQEEFKKRSVLTSTVEAFTWQAIISQGIVRDRNDWYDQMANNSGRGMIMKARHITNINIMKYVEKKTNWLLNEV